MKRLSITLTDEANKIYESWKSHERSKKVSQAIIQYFDGKDGVTLTEADKQWVREEIQRQEIARVKELEGKA